MRPSYPSYEPSDCVLYSSFFSRNLLVILYLQLSLRVRKNIIHCISFEQLIPSLETQYNHMYAILLSNITIIINNFEPRSYNSFALAHIFLLKKYKMITRCCYMLLQQSRDTNWQRMYLMTCQIHFSDDNVIIDQ